MIMPFPNFNCSTWHNSKILEIPENISLVKLPPYSPEINPTERFFQYMKGKNN